MKTLKQHHLVSGYHSESKFLRADGVFFLTSEYNRSVPAVLKNAIDVASRPYGQNSWNGKPGAVLSVSIGNISGFGANHHLRQPLFFVNVPTMAQLKPTLEERQLYLMIMGI
jgi:NAD(P)H-dependent FMN reductase